MSLYLEVRAAWLVALVVAAVTALLAWPGSSLEATPSPTGATMMAGVFLAIAVPAAVGWGCSRGDERLEGTGVRPVRWADLAYAGGASAILAVAGAGLHAVGMADAGLVSARATIVYLGLLVLAVPFWGWRLAPVLPAVFLLAVAVFGRGEDFAHPAVWAWIAAQASDPGSWALTLFVLAAGIVAYAVIPRRLDIGAEGDGAT